VLAAAACVMGHLLPRTSQNSVKAKFAFWGFSEVRIDGVLRSSRLQSPPAQPRSSNYRTTLRPLRTQNRSLVTTIVARIRYERLRLPTLIVPENFHNFDAPWDRGKASFSKGWYLAKDAPRRVVQAEGILYFAEGLF
jgi:hypothetical protein